MALHRAILVALGVLVVSTSGAGSAAAQSSDRRCEQLRARLVSLDSRPRASSQALKFERAIRDQKGQITKTETIARQNGCNSFFGIRDIGMCRRVVRSLADMQDNLVSLQRQLAAMGGGGGDGSADQARRLRGQMVRLGCDERRELVRRISVEQEAAPRGDPASPQEMLTGPPIRRGAAGTYRTLCVRMCDGYYFPISFSTTSSYFGRDEDICQARCPGQDVALFVHGQPDEDSEDMISYRGRVPYTRMTTAFSYRDKIDETCACRAAALDGLSEIAGSTRTVEPQKVAPPTRTPVPSLRADRGIDPETADNTGGGFTPDMLAAIEGRGEAGLLADTGGKKPVRVVGPAFFPVR